MTLLALQKLKMSQRYAEKTLRDLSSITTHDGATLFYIAMEKKKYDTFFHLFEKIQDEEYLSDVLYRVPNGIDKSSFFFETIDFLTQYVVDSKTDCSINKIQLLKKIRQTVQSRRDVTPYSLFRKNRIPQLDTMKKNIDEKLDNISVMFRGKQFEKDDVPPWWNNYYPDHSL